MSKHYFVQLFVVFLSSTLACDHLMTEHTLVFKQLQQDFGGLIQCLQTDVSSSNIYFMKLATDRTE